MYDLSASHKQEMSHYRDLLKLTHQLEQTAEQGKMEDLQRLFSKREKMLAKISAHNTLSEEVNKLSAKEQQEFSEPIEEIREIIEEVIETDRKIEKKRKAKMDGIGDKLTKIRQGHKALKGYAPKRRHIPRYISKKL